MLIILPPSETKTRPPDGEPPFSFRELSFPALTPMRRRVAEALIETSAQPDGLERLRVGPALIEEVARNTRLRKLPAAPAAFIYSGPLHAAFDAASLSPAAAARAASEVVIASALWGAVRPTDRIPAYRLDVCSRLIGLDRLEPMWRRVLPDVLAEAAGPRGVVLDLRSPAYQAIGKPAGTGGRTVTVRVQGEPGSGTVGNVVAKRIRGQVARLVLESGKDPDEPGELAVLIGENWPVRLDPPMSPHLPWTLRLRERD